MAQDGKVSDLPLASLKHNRNSSLSTIPSLATMTLASDPVSTREEVSRSLISLVTGLYALLLVILCFAFEMSALNIARLKPMKYEIFYIYLYAGSLLVLAFFYYLLKVPQIRMRQASWMTSLVKRRESATKPDRSPSTENTKLNGVTDEDSACDAEVTYCQRPAFSHSASGCSLYLRLGAIVFGTVAVVENCLKLFSFFETNCWNTIMVVALVIFTIFIYLQVYFIFVNSKLIFHGHTILTKLGLMHIVATNICIWIRSIVIEEYHISNEIEEMKEMIHKRQDHPNVSTESSSSSEDEMDQRRALSQNTLKLIQLSPDCRKQTENVMTSILNNVEPFMTTCVVEYSIICAGVMFILWMNSGSKSQGTGPQHKKHNIRVDCGSSNRGLFTGLMCLVFTMVSLVIFFVESHGNNAKAPRKALLVFYCSDIILFVLTSFACVITFFSFRKLRFVPIKSKALASLRRMALLDDLLLIVALTGQLLYCIFSIVAIVEISIEAALHICVSLLRLIQVLLQTVVILTGQRLIALSAKSQRNKPGREMVTFLLVVNIALWLINTFETQKISANPLLIQFYGDVPYAWGVAVHGSIPLTIFYRFHSSVCLAEIWKNAYKTRS